LPTTNTLEFAANSLAQYRIAPLGVFSWYDGAGGTRMTLNSTGLGVGTAPANDKILSLGSIGILLSGATSDFSFRNSGGTAIQRLRYTDATGALTIGSATGTAYPVELGGNTTTRAVTIDASSNVGVGVTPSAWGSNQKALQVGSLTSIYNDAFNGASVVGYNVYQSGNSTYNYITTGITAARYEQRSASHFWYNAGSGTAGNAITFTQAMTLDASGRLLIGTVTSGTAAGDGVVKLGTYGHCISQTGTSIASGSSIDLTVVTSGAGYQGFLSVANTQDASANTRTQTTYSVFGRGTSATFTQIATANGSVAGASFTVTTPSNGVIRITNTSGAAATISAQFFGGASA
jgi:hypothetical protein